jgi:hypothetical protein
MHITPEQRREAAKIATEQQRYFYESEEAAEKLYSIAEQNQLNPEQTSRVIEEVANVVLGFYPQGKLIELFTEDNLLTQPQALRLTADILDYLAPLTAEATPTDTPPVAAKVPATSNPTPMPPSPIPTPQPTNTIPTPPPAEPADSRSVPIKSIAEEIAETEADIASVPPMHTMATDMEKTKVHQKTNSDIPVYTSTQTALLREQPPVPNNSPRWESELND